MFSWKEALDRMLFFFIFVILFVIVLSIVKWLQSLIFPHDPYLLPQGNAVKAFHTITEGHKESTMLDRLFLFYLHGEK